MGVRINESPDDAELYRATSELARELDPLRPLGGVRNFPGSEMFEDVYTFNDFTHAGEDGDSKPEQGEKKVPYLITEHNGHMFPAKRYDAEPHRVEHALRHYRVLKAAFSRKRVAGQSVGACAITIPITNSEAATRFVITGFWICSEFPNTPLTFMPRYRMKTGHGSSRDNELRRLSGELYRKRLCRHQS